MKSAAENLTPVTLELGGKSPVVIHETYSLKSAANRIVFGKFVNCGQTCIAPDYVLCPKDKVDELVEALQQSIQKSFPTLKDNKDYTAIINDGHLTNLRSLIEDAKQKGAKVTVVNPKSESLLHKLEPHLITNVSDDMLLMQEEIFGPILPIVPYTDLNSALDYINKRSSPLAMYYFDRNRKRVNAFLQKTYSGGVAINDTILQISQVDLPFGGVGGSGIGRYHGKSGFEGFSHEKSVFHQSRFAITPLLTRAPYKKFVYSLIRILMRF